MKHTILNRASRLFIAIFLAMGVGISYGTQLVLGQTKTEANDDSLSHANRDQENPGSAKGKPATGNLAISDNSSKSSVEPFVIPGPKVGESIPEIELKDQDGNWVSVSDKLQNGPVALIFYRSANWCPYCKRHLIKLKRQIQQFEEAGLQVIGISYDKVSDLRVFANAKKISYPLLSDDGSKVIREMGLEFERGIPHPGTFIVDHEGVIRAKFFMQGYKKRHSNDEILAAFNDLELMALAL